MEVNMKDKITIVIPTHVLPTAPSTEIIEETLSSLTQIKEIEGCECIITCDTPSSFDADRAANYLKNLSEITETNDFFEIAISVVIDGQQRANFLNGIEKVKTPYFLFMEHDWCFIETPNITKLVEAMDNHKKINVVYFNKRRNIERPKLEFVLKPDKEITELPLLKTTKWSNNPNLTRTSKWANEWLEIVKHAPLYRGDPKKQIEPILHGIYKQQIINEGFDSAHSKWGTYSYGEIGKNHMVIHIDGSQRGIDERYHKHPIQ